MVISEPYDSWVSVGHLAPACAGTLYAPAYLRLWYTTSSADWTIFPTLASTYSATRIVGYLSGFEPPYTKFTTWRFTIKLQTPYGVGDGPRTRNLLFGVAERIRTAILYLEGRSSAIELQPPVLTPTNISSFLSILPAPSSVPRTVTIC